MGPGLGPAAPYYTVLAEDLASNGYIVVGYTPSYSTDVAFPDARVVPSVNAARDGAVLLDQLLTVWAGDVRFVMDQLVVLNGTASGRSPAGSIFSGSASSLTRSAARPRWRSVISMDAARPRSTSMARRWGT
jgi:hypothetical protein